MDHWLYIFGISFDILDAADNAWPDVINGVFSGVLDGTPNTCISHSCWSHSYWSHSCWSHSYWSYSCWSHSCWSHSCWSHSCWSHSCWSHSCWSHSCWSHSCWSHSCWSHSCLSHSCWSHSCWFHSCWSHSCWYHSCWSHSCWSHSCALIIAWWSAFPRQVNALSALEVNKNTSEYAWVHSHGAIQCMQFASVTMDGWGCSNRMSDRSLASFHLLSII